MSATEEFSRINVQGLKTPYPVLLKTQELVLLLGDVSRSLVGTDLFVLTVEWNIAPTVFLVASYVALGLLLG